MEVPVAPPGSISYQRSAAQFADADEESAPSLWATGGG